MAHKDCGRIGFAFASACVVGKNPEDPKLSPMADNAIIRDSVGGLGSLVYICVINSRVGGGVTLTVAENSQWCYIN